jgi:iron complex transport system substrate-binding protein
VRVVSLLPAGTEIVAALGAADFLVGISHECDYPPSVTHLPRITSTPIGSDAPAGMIDSAVRRLRQSGQPVIAVDGARLLALEPDLIVTQALCEVCAVAEGHILGLAQTLPGARVLSLRAENMDGIWSDIRTVGGALGLLEEAEELVVELEHRLDQIRRHRPAAPPRVACVEWLDPLYLAGHWVPEDVECAGGTDVVGRAGDRSPQRQWAELKLLRPDLILVMVCGYGVDRARRELERLDDPDAWKVLSDAPAYILDANAYTSRPGPRVVEGAQRIQDAILNRVPPDLERWSPTMRYSRLSPKRSAS